MDTRFLGKRKRGDEVLKDYQHVLTMQELDTGMGVVAHSFDPTSWEAEAGGSVGLRPAWFIQRVPGQPHRDLVSIQQQNK